MNNNTKRIIEQLKKGLDITNIQLADALSDIDSDPSGGGGNSAFEDYTEAGGTKTEEGFKTSLVKSIDNPVLTSEQTLDDDQKAQARTNIGAASEEVIGNINSILDTINGEVI